MEQWIKVKLNYDQCRNSCTSRTGDKIVILILQKDSDPVRSGSASEVKTGKSHLANSDGAVDIGDAPVFGLSCLTVHVVLLYVICKENG